MNQSPSSSRLVTTNPETRSAFAEGRGRAVTAAVAMAAMVMGATVPIPAMAGPADIDTNYTGPADIDTSYQDGSVTSARALTVQGQAAFDSGDYMGAATAWRKILDILPENDVNREERENALLISLEAYKQAFRRVSVERGSVKGSDVDLLREALKLCDTYTKEVGRVHGPTGVSPAVVESRVEIEGMLAEAGPVDDTRTPIVAPPNTGVVLEPDVIHRGKSGTGLIAAGSVSIVVGLAMMPLVIIGAQRHKQAKADITEGMSDNNDAAVRDAEDRKRSANAMIISGSILMGVLTIGGATMLGIGIRRRIRYTAFAPTVGPNYVGLSLQRRF